MSRPRHTLNDLETLEAESIHILREVAAEMNRPCLLFSGGKDSVVMLRIAEKAFAPARIPFPVMHVDTGLNFPELLAFRDASGRPNSGSSCWWPACPQAIESWSGPARAERLPEPDPDAGAARGRRRTRLRRPVRRGPAGRGEVPGQRADLLVPGRVRPVGSRRTSDRRSGTSTTAGSSRARASGSSRCRTGPSWTSGGSSTRSSSPCRDLYFAAEREVVDPRAACCTRSTISSRSRDGEQVENRRVRYRTMGDANLTAAVGIRVADRRRGDHRDWRPPG